MSIPSQTKVQQQPAADVSQKLLASFASGGLAALEAGSKGCLGAVVLGMVHIAEAVHGHHWAQTVTLEAVTVESDGSIIYSLAAESYLGDGAASLLRPRFIAIGASDPEHFVALAILPAPCGKVYRAVFCDGLATESGKLAAQAVLANILKGYQFAIDPVLHKAYVPEQRDTWSCAWRCILHMEAF